MSASALLVALAFWGLVPIQASISVTGYVNGDSAGIAEASLTNLSASISGGSQTTYTFASFAASPGHGSLGINMGGRAACSAADGCGLQVARGQIWLSFIDVLQIGGVSSGFLSMTSSLSGSFGFSGQSSANNAGASLMWHLNSGQQQVSSTSTRAYSSNGLSIDGEPQPADIPPNTLGGTYAPLLLPFSASNATIGATLYASFQCVAGTNQNCDTSVNYGHTAKFFNAQVFDQNMNLVAGATVTSESGYDYTQPLAESVPEPGSIWLLSLSVPALLVWRRRR